MAKKSKRPAANNWSCVPCLNALDTESHEPYSLPISESTWVADAVYQTEPSAPIDGYFLPFANASDCLGWFRWWVLPACCLDEGADFTPDSVKLEGEFARVGEVIDNSEEGVLRWSQGGLEASSGQGHRGNPGSPLELARHGRVAVAVSRGRKPRGTRTRWHGRLRH